MSAYIIICMTINVATAAYCLAASRGHSARYALLLVAALNIIFALVNFMFLIGVF